MKVYAVDLFCGVGGLTCGMQKAGIKVMAGYDIEESCRFPYEYNNHAEFVHKDIKEVTVEEVLSKYPPDTEIKVLMGCAPCQPFSSYSHKYKGNKNLIQKMELLSYFGNLIEKIKPEIVSMENVPQLVHEPVFKDFVNTLNNNGYAIDYKVVFAPEYGVPQNRKRLLLLASRIGEIKLIDPLFTKDNFPTVRDAIGKLKKLESGEVDSEDDLHRTRKLSDLNLERIKASRPGGSWKEWDEKLLPECYKKITGNTFKSVYGRLEWDKPSSTITTQFIGYGNGRFGHPEQNRALSLREGALLQTFPENYKFYDGQISSVNKVAVQIGNAVPPKLGEVIGISIINLLNKI